MAPLPSGQDGHCNERTRTLTMAGSLLSEDPRVQAAGLVHELQHAADLDLVALGLLERDCVELETRAFEVQAKVVRGFSPDELLVGTDWENGLAMIVATYEADGLDGPRAMVRQDTGYRDRCL